MTRLIRNTVKHIYRSGWLGIASTIVMTLSFLIISIFGGFAYFAHLYIKFIEQKSNLIVFFDVGMDQTIVERLKTKWDGYDEIISIDYLNEDDAFTLYADYAKRAKPDEYLAMSNLEEKKLDSSLEIRLNSLENLAKISNSISIDIEKELEGLKVYDLNNQSEGVLGITTATTNYTYKYSLDGQTPPINLKVDVEALEEIKGIMDKVRLSGIVILGLLGVVVVIFIFLISEFRIYNQKEEIGVMQLVGGSLTFIRAPYILEGGSYGATGAFLTTSLLGILGYWVFEINKTSQPVLFLYKYFSVLDWPSFTLSNLAVISLSFIIFGFILGATSSYLSIRRYIR